MRIKSLIIVMLMALVSIPISAQSRESFDEYKKRQKASFSDYKEKRRKEFEEYRRKRNEEFAKYMRESWTNIKPSPVIPKPKDDPKPPVVIPKDEPAPVAPPAPKPLPFDEVLPAPKPTPQPKPVDPIEEIPVTPVTPAPSYVSFSFFGTPAKVRFDKKNTVHLAGLNENAIADAWLKLSEEAYTNLIHDCLEIRDNHDLGDWAYLMMLQSMSESIYGRNSNDAVLLMAYVYCQSGYKMRMAIGDNNLYMMFASLHDIYNWHYYKLDGVNYYTFNNKTGNVRICDLKYPNEAPMSLLINKEQKFTSTPTVASEHQSSKYSDMKVSAKANKNRLDFYSSYPTSKIGENFVTRWSMYANTPMPAEVRNEVYPQLKKTISGLDQLTAVNKILNWVQTGFVYEYDDKVWGEDRAFFPEESLHYPYCDCEDRSILFTRIVRDLLGLNCILIYYPGHLASAVCFTDHVSGGDYLDLNGKRYHIADPTYIGAPVGLTMPDMDNATSKVILLD